MPALTADQLPLDPRIRSWIDAIVPCTPKLPPSTNPRKRSAKTADNNPRPIQRTTRKALMPTSGNMAPPRKENEEKEMDRAKTLPTRTLRSSAKNAPATPAKLKRTQEQSDAQDENTPRSVWDPDYVQEPPVAQGPIPHLPPPAEPSANDAPIYGPPSPSVSSKGRNDISVGESAGRSLSRGPSSRRDRSPAKKLTDLILAEPPTTLEKLTGTTAREAGGVLNTYPALVKLRFGEGLIPEGMQKLIEKTLDPVDHYPLSCYNSTLNTEYDQIMSDKVLGILEEAWNCQKDEVTEVVWNEKVHGPLLRLMVDQPKYNGNIASQNITQARIAPKRICMSHLSGSKVEDKMVDFGLFLKPKGKEEQQKIRHTLRDPKQKDIESLNQSLHQSQRFIPAFLFTETKPPFTGGPTADVQLIVWQTAGFNKLREMLISNGHEDEPIPTFPLLSFHGHHVYLSALREGAEEENYYHSALHLGSTTDILGVYQILKALDILVNWGNTEYRAWWFSKVAKAA